MPNSNTVNLILNEEAPTDQSAGRRFEPEKFGYYEEIYKDYLGLKSKIQWGATYGKYKNVVGEGEENGYPKHTNDSEGFKGTLDHLFYTSNR